MGTPGQSERGHAPEGEIRSHCSVPPKAKNRETEVSRGFRFFVSGRRFCEEIIGEMLGFLDYFS